MIRCCRHYSLDIIQINKRFMNLNILQVEILIDLSTISTSFIHLIYFILFDKHLSALRVRLIQVSTVYRPVHNLGKVGMLTLQSPIAGDSGRRVLPRG